MLELFRERAERQNDKCVPVRRSIRHAEVLLASRAACFLQRVGPCQTARFCKPTAALIFEVVSTSRGPDRGLIINWWLSFYDPG